MQDEGVEYYVVFCDSDIKWLKCLKPGFRHCFIMRLEYGQLWTVINHGMKGLEVQTYLREDYESPEDYARKGSTVLKVDKEEQPGRGWLDCVSVTKSVLGIKKPFIITPYQLYRWLYGRRSDTRRKEKAKSSSKNAARIDSETAPDATV